MNNHSKTNQMALDLADIDFTKLYRVAKKVQTFLSRKIDDPIEIYLLLKILCYSVEDNFGFRLDIDQEQKFKELFS